VRVYDVDNARCIFLHEGHRSHLSGAAVSPDGKRVVSASLDGTLRGAEIVESRHAASAIPKYGVEVCVMLAVPQGIVIGGKDGSVSLRMATGEALWSSNGHGAFQVSALAWHEGVLFSTGYDHRLLRWDIEQGEVDEQSATVMSPSSMAVGDGALAVLGPRELAVYDPRTLRCKRRYPLRNGQRLAPSIDHGELQISSAHPIRSSERAIVSVDAASGRELRRIEGMGDLVWGLRVVDTRVMAWTRQGEVLSWEHGTGGPPERVATHTKLRGGDLRGPLLAAIGVEGEVVVFHAATGALVTQHRGAEPATVVVFVDDRTVAIGDLAGGVTLLPV